MTQGLRDAMKARPLVARWQLLGRLELLTAAHLGGGEGEGIDKVLLRDAKEGHPLLPGTTLAGALRGALADHLEGFGTKEAGNVAELFGGGRGRDEGAQSPLIVFDAMFKGAKIELRDGVAIDPETGTAEDHKKYDYEVLPAGSSCDLRLELVVSDPAQEQTQLKLLCAALEALEAGQVSLGAKRSRGLGRLKVSWSARRFDLSDAKGWLEWACSDHEPRLGPVLAPLKKALADAGEKVSGAVEDKRGVARIKLTLEVEHDLLIRSVGETPDGEDVQHLHSGGRPVLPGTSLAGVLRGQALRIARLVRDPQGDAEAWIDRLFGPRIVGVRSPGTEMKASRLRVGEGTLQKGSMDRKQVRVAIDRFTQGTVDTALFEERPLVGGEVVLPLELRSPEPGELGLVVLVLKDLLSGRLAVGGTSSVGRGFLKGSAEVVWRRPGESEVKEVKVTLKPGEAPSGDREALEAEIAAFRRGEALVVKGGRDEREAG
jgi:CRISPR/Cas system CSM-associated protein Csm3 (group 7 of RAMP superfamily)